MSNNCCGGCSAGRSRAAAISVPARTPFDDLVVNLKIEQGNVVVEDLHVDGPSVKLVVGGQASVPTRDLDLKGVATLIAAANTDEFDLPFVVQGPWDDPIMLPDAQA